MYFKLYFITARNVVAAKLSFHRFDFQSKTLGGAMDCQKSNTTFLTPSQRVKAYLLLRYCIKNQSISVA